MKKPSDSILHALSSVIVPFLDANEHEDSELWAGVTTAKRAATEKAIGWLRNIPAPPASAPQRAQGVRVCWNGTTDDVPEWHECIHDVCRCHSHAILLLDPPDSTGREGE